MLTLFSAVLAGFQIVAVEIPEADLFVPPVVSVLGISSGSAASGAGNLQQAPVARVRQNTLGVSAASVSSDAITRTTLPLSVRDFDFKWKSGAQDTVRRRRAVEYSNGYAVRAKIHKIGSYAMLPLFGAQYYLGDRLLDDDDAGWMGSAHSAVAGTIGVLFVVNTVTGGWNLWESRHDPAGRTRRILHSVLLTAADAGFALTASLAEDNDNGPNANHRHRDVALGSIALSTIGTVMMWVWK